MNAGPDQTITFPSSATLNGTVTDDGLPSIAGLHDEAVDEDLRAGNGHLHQPDHRQHGRELLPGRHLRASPDGERRAAVGFDEVTVTVNPQAAGNQAPVVNAGPDQTVTFPTTVTLNGSVTDDGLPAVPGSTTKQWTKTSGPGTVTFTSPTTANTDASSPRPGPTCFA